MQAFERLKIVHLFSLTHYVIVLKYSLSLLLLLLLLYQGVWYEYSTTCSRHTDFKKLVFFLFFLGMGIQIDPKNSSQNQNRNCCSSLLTLYFHREIKRCFN